MTGSTHGTPFLTGTMLRLSLYSRIQAAFICVIIVGQRKAEVMVVRMGGSCARIG